MDNHTIKFFLLLGALLISALAQAQTADTSAYLVDSRGNVVKSGFP